MHIKNKEKEKRKEKKRKEKKRKGLLCVELLLNQNHK